METAESKRQKPSVHSSRQMILKPPSSSVSNNKRIVSTKGKPVAEYKTEEYQRSDRSKRPDGDRKARVSSGSTRELYKGQPEKTCMRKRDVDRRAKSSTPDGSEVVKVFAAVEIKQFFETFIRHVLLGLCVYPNNVL